MQKLTLDFQENYIFPYRRKILENNIIDRKSKYTTVGGFITKKENVKELK